MVIHNLSRSIHLPRYGKIKLGIKKTSAKGIEFPEESPNFILNPIEEILDKNGNPVMDSVKRTPIVRINANIKKLIEVLGTDTPAELDIFFPVDNEDIFFPHYMKWWSGNISKGKSALFCKGNGRYAYYKGNIQVDGIDLACPRPNENEEHSFPHGFNRVCKGGECSQAIAAEKDRPPKCSPMMSLIFMIRGFDHGVFQIDSRSVQAMSNVMNCINMARISLGYYGIKSLAGVPMKLSRVRTPNNRGGVNYILNLLVNSSELDTQKELLMRGKQSTLMYGDSTRRLAYNLDSTILSDEEPDYDLLPQNEHGRYQSGDEKLIAMTIADDEATVAQKQIQEQDIESWLQDPVVLEKFEKIGRSKNLDSVPKAKMLATAKNYKTKEELLVYLDTL